MSIIDILASSLGRKDEEPNIEIAVLLCNNKNALDIECIISGYNGNNINIANDCIKVLYEIGERKPELIACYVDSFIKQLSSKNNRIVWGSMTALRTIAHLEPLKIFDNLEKILDAYVKGSVITIDNSITVLSVVCSSDKKYEKVIWPILINHLKVCRSKEIPQHASRMIVCLNKANTIEFIDILEARKDEYSDTQYKRIKQIIKHVNKLIE